MDWEAFITASWPGRPWFALSDLCGPNRWLATCWVSARAPGILQRRSVEVLEPQLQRRTDEHRMQPGQRPGRGDRAEPAGQPGRRADPGGQPGWVEHPGQPRQERGGILRGLDDLAQVILEQRIDPEVREQLE